MMKNYCKTVIEKLYIQALVQGNVDAELATNTVQNFASTLKCQSMKRDEQRKVSLKILISTKNLSLSFSVQSL